MKTSTTIRQELEAHRGSQLAKLSEYYQLKQREEELKREIMGHGSAAKSLEALLQTAEAIESMATPENNDDGEQNPLETVD